MICALYIYIILEHSSALALSMKKIMGLEQSIKMYKFTAKDVAKCLGDCVHDGVTMNVSKEELEEMHTVYTLKNLYPIIFNIFFFSNYIL